MEYIVMLVMVCLLFTPLIAAYKKVVTGNKAKYALVANIASFFAFCVIAVGVGIGQSAFAADTAAVADASSGLAQGLGYVAASFAVGVSCIGGGIAVSGAASAALGAISENDKAFGKSLIFVGLAEGVALYGLLIAFMILSKL